MAIAAKFAMTADGILNDNATEANILIRALGMGRSYQDQIDDKDVTLLARMRFLQVSNSDMSVLLT